MAPPVIFDRALVRRRRARALAAGFADFLMARASEDLAGRLDAVTRRFSHALDCGSPHPIASQVLAARESIGRVTRLAGPGPARADVVGDEERLPFAPASFDLVVSLLALQDLNDLPGTLAQIRRAMRPDGLFLGCLFGGTTLNELREAFTRAEAEIEGGVSPRVAPFADLRDLGGLLQRAGFALPVTDVDTVTVRYRDPFALMRDLRAMGLANALHARRRVPLRRSTLMRAAAIYAERFSDPDGRVRATFEIVWLSGWVPHESQQRPLQPGSARARLADALGAEEIALPERREQPEEDEPSA